MNLFLFVPGLVLVLVAVVEALWTTLWIDGNSAPITGRFTTLLWRINRAILPSKNHHLLSLNGPLTLFLTVVGWVMLLWAGWVLLFLADPDSLYHSTTQNPADLLGHIYFVAYAMSTMGNGDYKVGQGFWEIAASFTTLSGMLFITLSVTYVIQVVSAAVNKRSFSDSITGFGMRSEEMVLALWNGRDFGSVDLLLNSLKGQLGTLTEQHLAYPILHYYHAREDRKASALAVVILDEALSLIEFGVHPDVRPSPGIVRSARRSIWSYLQSLRTAFISAADREPPPPDLGMLRAAGVPTVEDGEFRAALQGISERRKLMLGMTENGGWYWPREAGSQPYPGG